MDEAVRIGTYMADRSSPRIAVPILTVTISPKSCYPSDMMLVPETVSQRMREDQTQVQSVGVKKKFQ